MHDDPTRVMGQPEEPGRPGGGRPHGNTRLLIAGLIAVIAGLAVAIVVIASDGGDSDTPPVTTLPTTAETTTTSPTTTEPTTTETTEPTTTETTETTETTTAPTTSPEEEETGSGGIPAE
jgi:cytoskeletal protein RodZ